MFKRWMALAAGALLLAAAGTARADTLSVSADIPVLMSLKLGSTTVNNSVGGYTVGLSLPFLVGFGYESYQASLDKKDFGNSANLDFSILDIFINLPIPAVNIAIGVGAGTATFSPDNFTLVDPVLGNGKVSYGSAPVTQYFASLGIPIAAIFDVHLGYHVVSGKFDTKVKYAGSNSKKSTDLSSSMTSLGVKVGF